MLHVNSVKIMRNMLKVSPLFRLCFIFIYTLIRYLGRLVIPST